MIKFSPTLLFNCLFFSLLAQPNLPSLSPKSGVSSKIGEIGYMVEDRSKCAHWPNKQSSLLPHPPTTNDWWATGDANGLVLCLPVGRDLGDCPKGKSKKIRCFPNQVEHSGRANGRTCI